MISSSVYDIWTHGEIVAFLKVRYKLRPWWQQGVASGFEIATGRRVDGQNTKGLYTTTATKSLQCPGGSATSVRGGFDQCGATQLPMP